MGKRGRGIGGFGREAAGEAGGGAEGLGGAEEACGVHGGWILGGSVERKGEGGSARTWAKSIVLQRLSMR